MNGGRRITMMKPASLVVTRFGLVVKPFDPCYSIVCTKFYASGL